jgi:hypothetical protein
VHAIRIQVVEVGFRTRAREDEKRGRSAHNGRSDFGDQLVDGWRYVGRRLCLAIGSTVFTHWTKRRRVKTLV